MRLFVAVVPPPVVREEALRGARSLPWEGNVRWLPPENVHLTLKFLGEIPETEIPALTPALGAACAEHAAFELALSGAGAFPSKKRARVLWVGVGEGSQALRELAGTVEEALASLGFAREKRPFHPHATVGRARGEEVRLGESERETGIGSLRFRVEAVDLVQSRLSKEEAVYSTVASFPLGTGSPPV